MAEFIAAEEMGRSRGFWWSPESDRLLVARVDDTPVRRWWISDPAHPERDPQHVPYPAAGTANADVRLFVVDLGVDHRPRVRGDEHSGLRLSFGDEAWCRDGEGAGRDGQCAEPHPLSAFGILCLDLDAGDVPLRDDVDLRPAITPDPRFSSLDTEACFGRDLD